MAAPLLALRRASAGAGGPASACRVQKQTAVNEEGTGGGVCLEGGG